MMRWITAALLCMILVVPAVMAGPLDALKQYYEADKSENVDAMVALTDFSHIAAAERDGFMQRTKLMLTKLAQAFDTKAYSITNATVREKGSEALVFYRLNSEIVDLKGKTASTNLDFVANMHNDGGSWKVVYMQPRAMFDKRMGIQQLLTDIGENLGNVSESDLNFTTTDGSIVPGTINGTVVPPQNGGVVPNKPPPTGGGQITPPGSGKPVTPPPSQLKGNATTPPVPGESRYKSRFKLLAENTRIAYLLRNLFRLMGWGE